MKSLLKERLSSIVGLRSLWPLLLPLLLFLPGLNDFPFPSPDATFSDVAISHYPNALYLKRALTEWGVIPLWSPSILSGYPFAANPLAGLWYPPGWLALIFPLPMGFNVVVMAHLLLGGVGLYTFLRQKELSHEAALLGALAFESIPKIFAQYGAGHLTLVYAVAWTPWLLWCHVPRSKFQAVRSFRGWPGIILALIFLADPRWAPYAGLMWLVYVVAHRRSPVGGNFGVEGQLSKVQPFDRAQGRYLISNIVLSLLLAAPLAIPLLEYTRLSTRSTMTVEDIFAHSLPPARLLGLLFPDFGGFHEWMLYPGGVVMVLFLAAILSGARRGAIRFWLGVFVLSILYSIGSNLPLLPVLAQIPGFDLLRVPPRVLFLAGLSGAILAAYGLDILTRDSQVKWRRVSLGLVGVTAFVVVFALFIGLMTGVWSRGFLWGAGIILFGSLWVLLKRREQIPPQIWLVVLFGMAILDWGAVNASVLSFRSKEQVAHDDKALGELFTEQRDFRIYSPSYSLPQDVAALYGLELADGVDPLQLATYADYMDTATGVPRSGYSVTLPPYANGNPAKDNVAYQLDARALGILNVEYVVTSFALPVEGLVLLDQFDGTWIYENAHALSRAWVQPRDAEIGDGASVVESLDWRPNTISLQAEGPGLLVLSEIAYPGWRVKVDGEFAAMETPLGLLRGVELPPGEHQVTFYYRPLSIYLGLGCFVLGVLLLIWMNRDRRKKA